MHLEAMFAWSFWIWIYCPVTQNSIFLTLLHRRDPSQSKKVTVNCRSDSAFQTIF